MISLPGLLSIIERTKIDGVQSVSVFFDVGAEEPVIKLAKYIAPRRYQAFTDQACTVVAVRVVFNNKLELLFNECYQLHAGDSFVAVVGHDIC